MKTSKPVNFNLQIVILFTLTLFISAYGAVKGLRAIKNKDVKPQYISFQEKSIILTPRAHFSQVEYYENLKDSITRWKANGYTIFYEQIVSKTPGMDSTLSDHLSRKWRKIVGGVQMTREGYEELGEVKLDSCDFATSLDSTYTCSKKLKGKLNPIIVDYRNQQLVNRIIQSKSDKIAVVYGEIHLKGLKNLHLPI